MNEPAIRLEEQIISSFPEQETQVCRGWILKKTKKHLFIYPLYYKSAEDDISGRIRECEESARRNGIDCVFRIVEHTNYYLSAVLAESGYVVQRCGVVGVHTVEEEKTKRSVCEVGEEKTKRSVCEVEEEKVCQSACEVEGEKVRRSICEVEKGKLRRSIEAEKAKEVSRDACFAAETRIWRKICIGKKQETLLIVDQNLGDHVNLQEILQFSQENEMIQILADISGQEDLPGQYEQAGFRRIYSYHIYQKITDVIY